MGGDNDYSVVSSGGKVTVRVGDLEVVLGGEVDNTVLIRDVGEGEKTPSLRVTSRRSEKPGIFSRTAGFPPDGFDDDVEVQIMGFDPATGASCTNEVYLGKSGHFYQWGNNEARLFIPENTDGRS